MHISIRSCKCIFKPPKNHSNISYLLRNVAQIPIILMNIESTFESQYITIPRLRTLNNFHCGVNLREGIELFSTDPCTFRLMYFVHKIRSLNEFSVKYIKAIQGGRNNIDLERAVQERLEIFTFHLFINFPAPRAFGI